MLALGIGACVCLPMTGEVTGLMALYARHAGAWEAVLAWASLGWTMATFAIAAIAALWKICREAQRKA